MKILKKDDKNFIVQTGNGTKLEVTAVKQLPLQDLLFRVGVSSDLFDKTDAEDIAAALQANTLSEQMEVSRAAMALFNFCMAYGIKTDPPQEAIDELKALQLAPSSPRALRATWLNCLVLEDGKEAGTLVGLIIAVTFKKDLPNVGVVKPNTKPNPS